MFGFCADRPSARVLLTATAVVIALVWVAIGSVSSAFLTGAGLALVAASTVTASVATATLRHEVCPYELGGAGESPKMSQPFGTLPVVEPNELLVPLWSDAEPQDEPNPHRWWWAHGGSASAASCVLVRGLRAQARLQRDLLELDSGRGPWMSLSCATG